MAEMDSDHTLSPADGRFSTSWEWRESAGFGMEDEYPYVREGDNSSADLAPSTTGKRRCTSLHTPQSTWPGVPFEISKMRSMNSEASSRVSRGSGIYSFARRDEIAESDVSTCSEMEACDLIDSDDSAVDVFSKRRQLSRYNDRSFSDPICGFLAMNNEGATSNNTAEREGSIRITADQLHLGEDSHPAMEVVHVDETESETESDTGSRCTNSDGSCVRSVLRALSVCFHPAREEAKKRSKQQGVKNHGYSHNEGDSSCRQKNTRSASSPPYLGQRTFQSKGVCNYLSSPNEQYEISPSVRVPASDHNLDDFIHGISLDERVFLALFDRICQAMTSRGCDVVGRVVHIANFAAAMLDSRGGYLSIDALGVHLYIPPGAIPAGKEPQRVHIYVQGSLASGCNYLTPYVQCGPSDLRFNKDVFLIFPHCAKDTPENGKFTGIKFSSLGLLKTEDGLDGILLTKSTSVTIMTDHFCGYAAVGPIAAKYMLACVFTKVDKDEVLIRVRLFDYVKANLQEVKNKERKQGFSLAVTERQMEVISSGKDVLVTLLFEAESWKSPGSESGLQIQTFAYSVLWREYSPDIVPALPSKLFHARLCPSMEQVPFEARVNIVQEGNEDDGVQFLFQKPLHDVITSTTISEAKTRQKTHQVMSEQMTGPIQSDVRPLAVDTYQQLCEKLDASQPEGDDWRVLKENLPELQSCGHSWIRSIAERAERKRRSPTALLLDSFFAASRERGKGKWGALRELKRGLVAMTTKRPDMEFAIDAISDQLNRKGDRRRAANAVSCPGRLGDDSVSNDYARLRGGCFQRDKGDETNARTTPSTSENSAGSVEVCDPIHPPVTMEFIQDLNLERNDCVASFDRMWSKAKNEGIDVTGRVVQIANFAAAVLDSRGGYLSIDNSNVHLYVPPGAIPADKSPQRVYIFVQGCLSSGYDYLTPCVHCGPSNLKFEKDVILTVPHCADEVSKSKFTFVKTASGECPRNIKDGEDGAVVIKSSSITLAIDHFCGHGASGYTPAKNMLVCVFVNQTNDMEVRIRVRLLNNFKSNLQEIKDEERECGFFPTDTVKELKIQHTEEGVLAALSSTSESWKITYPVCGKQTVEASQLWRQFDPNAVPSFPSKLFFACRQSAEVVPFEGLMTVFQGGREEHAAEFFVQRPRDASSLTNLGVSPRDLDHLFWIMLCTAPALTDVRPLAETTHRELCELLDRENPLDNDWQLLARSLRGREGRNYGQEMVRSIEARAGRERRSPTELVLNTFFAESKEIGREKLRTLQELKSGLFQMRTVRPDLQPVIDAVDRQCLQCEGEDLTCTPQVLADGGEEGQWAEPIQIVDPGVGAGGDMRKWAEPVQITDPGVGAGGAKPKWAEPVPITDPDVGAGGAKPKWAEPVPITDPGVGAGGARPKSAEPVPITDPCVGASGAMPKSNSLESGVFSLNDEDL